MKKYTVSIDGGAEQDLREIAAYIAQRDSLQGAAEVAANIELQIGQLATFPNRGAHPLELLDYGNRDFREIHFKPYRILYRVLEKEVVIVLIADGRRDKRTLLARRLLAD